MSRPLAYLAGPDVFRPKASEIGRSKKAYLAKLGIEAFFPLDNDLSADGRSPHELAMAIAAANEAFMLEVARHGRPGVIFADMTPWHGPSMDVGTAFEVGFMSALAHREAGVTIIGYGADPRPFATRVAEDVYGGATHQTADGRLVGSDGMGIEDFGEAENLMITHAIRKTGGATYPNFETAAAAVARLASQA